MMSKLTILAHNCVKSIRSFVGALMYFVLWDLIFLLMVTEISCQSANFVTNNITITFAGRMCAVAMSPTFSRTTPPTGKNTCKSTTVSAGIGAADFGGFIFNYHQTHSLYFLCVLKWNLFLRPIVSQMQGIAYSLPHGV